MPTTVRVRALAVSAALAAVVPLLAASGPDAAAAPVVRPAGVVAAATACPGAPAWLSSTPDSTAPAAGITVRRWAGPNRAGARILVSVAQGDLTVVGLGVATSAHLGARAATTSLVAAARSAVGVNGGYFAAVGGVVQPVGAQVTRGVGLRLPPGRTQIVGVRHDGTIAAGSVQAGGQVVLAATASQHTRTLDVTSVNPAAIGSAGVAVVTSYGGAVVRKASWRVVVRHGKVTYSAAAAPSGAAAILGSGDLLLLAPNAAAAVLGSARVGDPVSASWSAIADDGTVLREALGSGGVVLAGGVTVASCTTPSGRTSRPRTMVAWSNPLARVLLVTVNAVGTGAQAPGTVGVQYTEMADIARHFGATDAVLMDGGGSTTMGEHLGGGIVRVDAPAAAAQRPVTDALVLH